MPIETFHNSGIDTSTEGGWQARKTSHTVTSEGKDANDEEADEIGAKVKMLRAKLIEYAGGAEFQDKEFVEAHGAIANLVGDLAARVIIEEVLEKMENPRGRLQVRIVIGDEIGKASSGKRAKGPSPQRKVYG